MLWELDVNFPLPPNLYLFNNHYAGYAPGSVELFSRLYNGSA